MTTITLKTTTGRTIKTNCRTAKGVINQWSCGYIPVNLPEWHGTEMYQGGELLGKIVSGGWVRAK